MKTEMKKKMNQRKKYYIEGVMNEFEEKKMYEKWTKIHSNMELWFYWKNLGFEHEGNGKQCYASLFLSDVL